MTSFDLRPFKEGRLYSSNLRVFTKDKKWEEMGGGRVTIDPWITKREVKLLCLGKGFISPERQ